jgi:hypothetical protein
MPVVLGQIGRFQPKLLQDRVPRARRDLTLVHRDDRAAIPKPDLAVRPIARLLRQLQALSLRQSAQAAKELVGLMQGI